MRRKYLAATTAALLALTLGLSACSSSKKTPAGSTGSSTTSTANAGSITIGSAGFAESEILADIYAGALRAKGVTVKTKLNIGERPVYYKALQDGSIDFFPEYNGSILAFLDSTATAKSTADVNAALKTALAAKGLTALDSAAAQDSDTITVTKETADKYHLTSIGDLSSVAGDLTLGAPAQFKTRPDGVPGLKSVYNVVFGTFTTTAAGGKVTVNALKNGSIDAADIFSTDPAIAANSFVSLQDPDNLFGAQNITPIATTSKLTPTITDAANAVSAKLDTATLAALVAKVQVDGEKAEDVANAWLTSVGLG